MEQMERTEIQEFAQDLHEAISEVENGDFEMTCTSANFVTYLFFPHAERYEGTYDGEEHEWARIDGEFFDVTASQFGGPAITVGSQPDEYEGEEVPMSEVGRGIANVNQIIEILEEKGWERY